MEFAKLKWAGVWEKLLPVVEGARVGSVRVVDEGGKAGRDVQWLQAGEVLNLYNPRPWAVKFRVEGERRGRDLLTGGEADFGKPIELRPLEVRMYRVGSAR